MENKLVKVVSLLSSLKVTTTTTNITSKDFILSHPRGCYTTCRTVNKSYLFDFDGHYQRLINGIKNAEWFNKQQKLCLNTILKKDLLLNFIKGGLEAYYFKNKDVMADSSGFETKITILVNVENLNYILKAHFDCLRQSLGDDNIALVLGAPRSSPNVKDSEWIKQRHELEQNIKNNVNEVLLHDERTTGLIEGLSSNLFVLYKGESDSLPIICTPSKQLVLEGTVRKLVIEICRANNIKFAEKTPLFKENQMWLGAFITSTSRTVLPLRVVKYGEDELVFSETHELIKKIKSLVGDKLIDMSTKIID